MAAAAHGSASKLFVLSDSVFQGTVLGPPLWNAFAADVEIPICNAGAFPVDYADDLNAWMSFPFSTPNEMVFDELRRAQNAIHRWGEDSRVCFDASKEEITIFHKTSGHGITTKLLGILFDPKLAMTDAVNAVVQKARPKVKSLLRTRRFHSKAFLIMLFKSHVLPILEFGTAAFYHASDSVLKPLDQIFEGFLSELGMDEAEAFLEHNFLHLRARRDVAMLGLLFRCAKGMCHPELRRLFPVNHVGSPESHKFQLVEHLLPPDPAYLQRSVHS